MSRKLLKSLKAQKSQTEQVKLTIYGSLGIPLGGQKVVQVANRQGYVYVRLRDNQNEVIQAFNNKVAASYDLPVIVIREGGRYIVQQFNSQRYLNNAQNSAPFLPGHGTQHSFPQGGGADITWIYGQQIMPGLVYPEVLTGTNVMIEKYPLLTPDGRWLLVGGTGTPNLLQYRPTTGSSSLMALVFVDANSGNPGILIGSGSYFPASISGSVYQYLPTPSNTQIPLAGVLLNTGTTTIGWGNIYDVRQWVHATPSGTSSGGGGGIDTIGFAGLAGGVPLGTGTSLNVRGAGATFTRSGTVFDLDIPGGVGGGGISGSFIQDEGIPKGFVTTFNFVGTTIDASVSGSVARIFVTGSTGGAVNPPVTGSFVVQNNGTTLGSATILNFTNGVTASISGSVAQIQVTGTATYVRTAPPVSLSSVTGAYWRTQENIFVSGSLAIFNQGHALIPAIDYLEQYPVSGTFQYISTPPTGTYNLAIYGVPVAGGNNGGGGGSSFSALAYSKTTRTAGDVTTTSTSFVDIHANLNITITTGARRCRVTLIASGNNNNTSQTCTDIEIDGVRVGNTYGLQVAGGTSGFNSNLGFSFETDILSAGSHTFKPQFRVDANTGRIYASSAISPVFFMVSELPLNDPT